MRKALSFPHVLQAPENHTGAGWNHGQILRQLGPWELIAWYLFGHLNQSTYRKTWGFKHFSLRMSRWIFLCDIFKVSVDAFPLFFFHIRPSDENSCFFFSSQYIESLIWGADICNPSKCLFEFNTGKQCDLNNSKWVKWSSLQKLTQTFLNIVGIKGQMSTSNIHQVLILRDH